jgi:hypothetical protein
MKRLFPIVWFALSLIFSVGWLFYFWDAKLANPGGFSMGYGAVYFIGFVVHVAGFAMLNFFSPNKLLIKMHLLLIAFYSVAGVLIAY